MGDTHEGLLKILLNEIDFNRLFGLVEYLFCWPGLRDNIFLSCIFLFGFCRQENAGQDVRASFCAGGGNN
jgi:hypothetical protein